MAVLVVEGQRRNAHVRAWRAYFLGPTTFCQGASAGSAKITKPLGAGTGLVVPWQS